MHHPLAQIKLENTPPDIKRKGGHSGLQTSLVISVVFPLLESCLLVADAADGDE